jgi:hypothetical protein
MFSCRQNSSEHLIGYSRINCLVWPSSYDLELAIQNRIFTSDLKNCLAIAVPKPYSSPVGGCDVKHLLCHNADPWAEWRDAAEGEPCFDAC